MELRHLRYFLTVAKELHFARAAERLHIKQSPLSRAIKELEEALGVRLFVRNQRGTRLTTAGEVFLQDVRRAFTSLTLTSAYAESSGYSGTLRIAVSDGISDPRLLSDWLARCRREEPEVEVQLAEVPLAEQLRGLREGHFDAGFTHTDDGGDGIVAQAIWHDPLMLALPARHPLLIHSRIPVNELVRYPLVTCYPHACEGRGRPVTHLLRALDEESAHIEQTTSLEMLLTLVAAGYGIGFVTAPQMSARLHPDVVVRPIVEGGGSMLTTYVLRKQANDSEQLSRFIARLSAHTEDHLVA